MKLLICVVVLSVLSLSLFQTQSKVIEWQDKPMGSNNERWTDGTQHFRIIDRVEIESITVGGEPVTIGQSLLPVTIGCAIL